MNRSHKRIKRRRKTKYPLRTRIAIWVWVRLSETIAFCRQLRIPEEIQNVLFIFTRKLIDVLLEKWIEIACIMTFAPLYHDIPVWIKHFLDIIFKD